MYQYIHYYWTIYQRLFSFHFTAVCYLNSLIYIYIVTFSHFANLQTYKFFWTIPQIAYYVQYCLIFLYQHCRVIQSKSKHCIHLYTYMLCSNSPTCFFPILKLYIYTQYTLSYALYSVSYTHLDVYKRQHQEDRPLWNCCQELN